MSIRTYKPTSPSRRAMTNSTLSVYPNLVVEITKVKLPAATLVEVINVNTVLLTSNVIKMAFQQ